MTSYKFIPGKGLSNDPQKPVEDVEIKIKITDDNTVPGFGMPITVALCRKLVNDFQAQQQSLFDLLNGLTPTPEIEELKASVSKKEIMAGSFGRDTFTGILEQEGCEGIMYVNCLYEGQKSIVLFGVDASGEIIGGKAQFLNNERPKDGDAVIYEIKGKSKSREEIIELIPPTV